MRSAIRHTEAWLYRRPLAAYLVWVAVWTILPGLYSHWRYLWPALALALVLGVPAIWLARIAYRADGRDQARPLS